MIEKNLILVMRALFDTDSMTLRRYWLPRAIKLPVNGDVYDLRERTLNSNSFCETLLWHCSFNCIDPLI